ncbi:MAG: DUF2180 family protein [Ruminococcus sp.]|nr:DUF2180 family protein [Ruminococcus sp.]
MKCYYHNDRDAVAQCSVCGRGLCRECTDRYEEPLCRKCGEEIAAEAEAERKEAHINSKKSAKMWIIAAFFAMFFMGVLSMSGAQSLASNAGEQTFGLIFGTYAGLGMAMGLEKTLNSKAAKLLSIPILGWILFLYAFAIQGAIFAIPEFIKLLKISVKK